MERGDGGGGGGGMEPRGGGVVGSAAMLGLDMHLAHPQMHAAAFQQPDHHGVGGGFQQVARQQPAYSPYSAAPAAAASRVVKAAGQGHGHEDDMGMGNGAAKGGGGGVVPGSAGCPWTRMKWTDEMVRLLINVVYSVGDDGDGGVAAASGTGGGKGAAAAHGKAGSGGHGHGGQAAAQQQKKGKWKSVSRAMMERGYMVSPQQCEDKFNDLNKRYKRVVDLLGRGTACKVVENHALLDTMDELPPKAKDEARKLLSSKHLFFREMCAYHNSGAAAANAHAPHGGAHGAEGAAACFHHPPPASMASASSAARQAAAFAPSPGMKDDSAGPDDDEDDSEDLPSSNEVDEDDDDDEVAPGMKHRGSGGHIYGGHRLHHHHNGHHKRRRGAGDDVFSAAAGDDDDDDAAGRKRARGIAPSVDDEGPSAVQQLQSELAAATAAGDPQQVRQWVRRRAVEVEEQQVAHEVRAYHLERQRLKWERFRANKERDMERARLRNDCLRIDGRRMLLLLRQKDLDFDIAEANSSSVDHLPTSSAGPPLAAAAASLHHQQQQIGSSPSAAGYPN